MSHGPEGPLAPRWRRLAPEARRRQLLDAAAAIIAEDGVAAATMDGVAARAGVSNGLVYRFFKNRADLLTALLDSYWAEMDADLRIADTSAQSEPSERARAEATVYVGLVPRRGPAFMRLRYRSGGVEPAVDERIAAKQDEVARRMARDLARDGDVPRRRAKVAARMLLAALEEGARTHAVDGVALDDVVAVHVAFTRALHEMRDAPAD